MKNNFDFLRLFLAYSVVWHHYLALTDTKANFLPYDLIDSSTAVRAFFVISGALIWESAVKTVSLKRFALKRFLRVYPAYILVILIMFLTAVYAFDADLKSSVSYFLWNTVFLNFMQHCIEGVFESNSICAVNGSLWTLKLEVTFYVFVAISIYGLKEWAKGVLILTTIASFLLHIIFVEYGFANLSVSILNQIPFVFFYFGLGALLYRPYLQLSSSLKALSFIFCSAIYLFFEAAYPLFVVSFVFFIAYSIPVYIDLRKLGDISYGAYILHFPLIQLMISFGVYGLGFYYDLFLTLGLVTLLSILLWRLIEKPSLEYSHGSKRLL